MRVAAMVIGILFAIWIFLEALVATTLFDVAGAENESVMAAGGLIVAIFVGIAAMLVLAVPHVSMVLFALGGLLSLLVASGGYGNHWVYAAFIFMLAVFAFFGRRGQLRDRREKEAERQRQARRDAQLDEMMRRQMQQQ